MPRTRFRQTLAVSMDEHASFNLAPYYYCFNDSGKDALQGAIH